jgi:hypothetical protein
MTAVLAAVALAVLLAAAYLLGRRVENRRTYADLQQLKAELDATYADFISIPAWPENTAYRQEIAIDHQVVQAEPRARLDAYFLGLGRAA